VPTICRKNLLAVQAVAAPLLTFTVLVCLIRTCVVATPLHIVRALFCFNDLVADAGAATSIAGDDFKIGESFWALVASLKPHIRATKAFVRVPHPAAALALLSAPHVFATLARSPGWIPFAITANALFCAPNAIAANASLSRVLVAATLRAGANFALSDAALTAFRAQHSH
jgi:hypothetical protein